MRAAILILFASAGPALATPAPILPILPGLPLTGPAAPVLCAPPTECDAVREA